MKLFVPIFLFLSISSVFSQFKITNGSFVTAIGNIQIVIADMNFDNAGTIKSQGSTFHFTGTADNTISSNGSFFDNITINKSQGKQLILNNPLNVKGFLNFVSGNIELNNQSINLGSTGAFIGETEISGITSIQGGSINATETLVAPTAVNVGNLGAVITSISNLGKVKVTREHFSANIPSANGKSIIRSYAFDVENNIDLNATLTFKYFDEEINGLDENKLTQFQTFDEINYIHKGYSSRDASSNFVTQSNYDNLSKITLSNFNGQVSVTNLDPFNFKVIPNPIFDIAQIEIGTIANNKGFLILYNAIGLQLIQQSISLTKGINLYPLNMSQFAKGFYNLEFVQNGRRIQNIKIIKL